MFDLNSYGKIVSFDVYPENILGDNYKTVKLLSIVDYATARLYSDVANIAISVYPSLPVGTPKDYKRYNYAKIEHSNGEVSCIALPWINSDTLVYHNDVIVTLKVKLDNINTVDTLRRLLVANNIKPLEITVE